MDFAPLPDVRDRDDPRRRHFGTLARAHSLEEFRRRVQVENIDPMDRSLLNQLVHAGVRERELAGSARPPS